MSELEGSASSVASADGTSADDPLAPLRGRLEAIGDLPVGERPALLEQANEALVDALNSLEEV